MADRQDLWKECYSGEHASAMSPEAFKFQFCSRCGNSTCVNSAAGQTGWQRRMDTQEDILLINPQYADPNDPRYKEVRELDFPNLLRKAMRLEIADTRGDWEPVTEKDAIEMAVDISRPTGFEPEPDPEPVIIRQEIMPGSGGKSYTTTIGEYNGEKLYDCTCPAFEFDRLDANGMCKHVRKLLGIADPKIGDTTPKKVDKRKAPQEAPIAVAPTRPSPGGRNSRPSAGQWQQVTDRNLAPKANNTTFPSDGMMVDGTLAPPPPEPVDPWAPKTVPVGTVVEIGGSFTLGGGKPSEEEGDE
jgi:hypothetical protein